MVDFHRDWGDPHRLTMAKLASLVEILERRDNSYLTWARSKDTEIYRAARDAGALSGSTRRPESFEMDQSTQILASLFFLIQQHIHVSARSKKRFQGKKWPSPLTAADLVKREDADRGYQDLMSEIVYLDPEEFDAHIEAHRGEHIEVRRELGSETGADANLPLGESAP